MANSRIAPRLLIGGLLAIAVSCDRAESEIRGSTEHAAVTFDPTTHGGSAADTTRVGTIAGTHTVDGRGHFNYTMPLTLPPARRGVGPELAINYNSGAGNGLFGMGFSLVGLSDITRCPGHPSSTPLPGAGFDLTTPGYGIADGYCLDGVRLVEVNNEGWFTTETDPTVRIEYALKAGEPPTPNFPPPPETCGFVAYRRDGTIVQYGCTDDSIEAAPDGGIPLTYALSKVWDRSANYWDVSYEKTDGAIQGPAVIRYTGNDETGDDPTRTITFEYTRDTNYRPDPLYDRRNPEVVIRDLVDRIVIESSKYNEKKWDYRFAYDSDGSTGRSRLESIKYCAEDLCLPATHFDWQIGQRGFQAPILTDAVAPVLHSPCSAPKVGDFDGDSIDDILSTGADCREVRLAKGDATHALVPHQFSSFVGELSVVLTADPNVPPLLIDLNGDAAVEYLRIRDDKKAYRIDFIKQTPPTYAVNHIQTATGIEILHAAVADMDGDGLGDILGCERMTTQCSNPGCGEWVYYRNLGDGTLASPVVGTSVGFGAHKCGTGRLRTVYPAGDGRVWFLSEATHWPDSESEDDAVLFVDPTGTTLTVQSNQRHPDSYGPRVFLDAWGDGRPDLLQFSEDQPDLLRIVRWVGIPTAAPFSHSGVLGRFVVMDENLDGTDDILRPVLDTAGAGPDGTHLGHWQINLVKGGTIGVDEDLAPLAWGEVPACNDYPVHAALTTPTYPGRIWETGVALRELNPFFANNGLLDWLAGGSFSLTQPCTDNGVSFDVCDEECLARSQPTAVGDFNGDGLSDFAIPSTAGRWIVYLHEPVLYDGLPAQGGADLIRHITDGFGGTLEVEYARMTDASVYERGSDCPSEVECFVDARTLTRWVQGTDNVVETFFYRDARRSRRDGRYLGFSEIERNTELSNASMRRVVRFDNGLVSVNHPTSTSMMESPFAGMPAEELFFVNDGGDATVERTTWDYEIHPGIAEDSYFTVPETTTREHFSFGLVGLPPNYPSEGSFSANRLTGTYVTTVESMDIHGLVKSRLETATGNNGELDKTRVETTFEKDDEKWLFGPKLIEVTRTNAAGENAYRRYDIQYTTSVGCGDCLGGSQPGMNSIEYVTQPFDRIEIEKLTVAKNVIDREHVTSFGYDDYGNVVEVSKSTAGELTRTSTFAFDADEHTFVAVMTNAEGHVEEIVWDPIMGRPRSMTSPFGTRVERSYDLFGRPIEDKTFDINGVQLDSVTTTSYVRLSGGAPENPSLLQVHFAKTGFGSTTTDYDDVGRPMRREWETAAGPVQQLYEFDELGHVRRASLPTAVGSMPHGGTWTRWDVRGRPMEEGFVDVDVLWTEEPDSSELEVTEHWYGWDFAEELFRHTATDAVGKIFTSYADHLGRTVKTVDGDGTAFCFGYGHFGGIETIERGCENGAPAGVSSYQIDDWGRTTISDDPGGSGTRAYLYNGFGEVREVVDGLGRRTTYEYDRLGRVVEYANDDGRATFTYDEITGSPAGGNLTAPGMLLSSNSTEGNKIFYGHDALGRIETAVFTVDGEEFSFAWQFDNLGRVSAQSYPHEDVDGFWILYRYDSVGLVDRIDHVNSLQTLWIAEERDDRGRVTLERYGNGLHSQTEFFGSTGRISSIRTGMLNGTTINSPVQDLEYKYYDNGSVYRRIIKESTWEVDQYEYDNVNRLVLRSTAVPVLDAAGNITSLGPTDDFKLAYDRFGNIEEHPVVGVIDSTPAGRVEAIDGVSSHVYNIVGQLEETDTEEITYNGLDKIATLRSGGVTFAYEYDASGNRVKRMTTVGRSVGRTVYVNDLYDRETSPTGTVTHRYHALANGRVVAVGTLQSGASNPHPTWNYLHADRLGSTHVTTDQNGTVVEKQLYDEWGLPRVSPLDAAFGVQGVPPGQLPHLGADVGFTGHRAAQDGALIDMGGRAYDPRIGRFTAPDPHMQFPLDTQNNAYSYVRNNPATFSDPTGFLSDGFCSWCSFGGGGGLVTTIIAFAVNELARGAAELRTTVLDVRAYVRETAESVSAAAAREQAAQEARRRARRERLAATSPTKWYDDNAVDPGRPRREPTFVESYLDFVIGEPARFVTNGLIENGSAMVDGIAVNVSDPLGIPGRAIGGFVDTAAQTVVSANDFAVSLANGEVREAAGHYGDAVGGAYMTAGAIVSARQLLTPGVCRGGVCTTGNGCFVEGTPVHLVDGVVPIEEVGVGERVQTVSGASETEVDETWRVAHVTVGDDDGNLFDIEVLRPLSWFEGRYPGQPVHVALDELGVEGWGQINEIRGAPPIASPPGRVVVTTVAHSNQDVYEISFDGAVASLQGTGSHPLYSLDRDAWVRVRDLRVGERLQTAAGAVAIAALERVRGGRLVHNLEVEGDHEYLVGESGIRAHNTCWLDKALKRYKTIPAWMKGLRPHGHHIIPQKAGKYWGNRLRALGRRNGITDHVNDPDNLTVAPNGTGTHKHATYRAIYYRLKEFDGLGEDAFRAALRHLGRDMRSGKWYRELGEID